MKANNNFGSLPSNSFAKNRMTALDMGKSFSKIFIATLIGQWRHHSDFRTLFLFGTFSQGLGAGTLVRVRQTLLKYS